MQLLQIEMAGAAHEKPVGFGRITFTLKTPNDTARAIYACSR
jgi:hypothetical protein